MSYFPLFEIGNVGVLWLANQENSALVLSRHLFCVMGLDGHHGRVRPSLARESFRQHDVISDGPSVHTCTEVHNVKDINKSITLQSHLAALYTAIYTDIGYISLEMMAVLKFIVLANMGHKCRQKEHQCEPM